MSKGHKGAPFDSTDGAFDNVKHHGGGGGKGPGGNDHHKRHRTRPCGNPPAKPTGVVVTYQATEARTHLRFTAKVKWNEVVTDEQAHGVNIKRYDVQMRATDVAGVPVENEDSAARLRTQVKVDPTRFKVRQAQIFSGTTAEFLLFRNHSFQVGDSIVSTGFKPTGYNGTWTVSNVPATNTVRADIGTSPAAATDLGVLYEAIDKFFVISRELPRPKTWYWQARVRAIDKDNCAGDWSAWTTASLPWTGADPEPPTPTFADPGCITFDHKDKSRHSKLRLLFTFNDMAPWDVPGGDHEDDLDRYEVQLDRSDDGITWDGRPYRKRLVPARRNVGSADGDDTNATRVAIFHAIRRRYWYRCRVRSFDRFNRPGDWSAFSSGALPFDDTQPPRATNVTIFDKSTNRIVLSWDDNTVDVDTRGTVSGTSGTATLTGTNTKFTVEVEAGSTVKVGGNTYIVRTVASDTSLTLTTNLSTSPSGAALKLIVDDPDVAVYEVQIAKSANVATAPTPDDWAAVYARDRTHGNRKSFRIPDADDSLTFFGRVRAVDAALNKSKWVYATVSGNSDPDVSGEGVTIGLGNGIAAIATFTKPGLLRVNDYPQRWINATGTNLLIRRARAVVSDHKKATHPNDGAPQGSPVKVNVQWISSKIGELAADITDSTTAITVNEIAGIVPPATSFAAKIISGGIEEVVNVTARTPGSPASYTITRNTDTEGASAFVAGTSIHADPEELKTDFEPRKMAILNSNDRLSVNAGSHKASKSASSFLIPIVEPDEQLSIKVTDVGSSGTPGSDLLVQVFMTEASADDDFWLPTNYDTLTGWWRADALSLADNTSVGTWNDESPTAANLTQGTAANKPTYFKNIRNGLPAVSFDGTNDRLTVASILGLGTNDTPWTVIAVVKSSGGAGTQRAFASWADSANNTEFLQARYNSSDAYSLAITDDAASAKQASGGSTGTAWHVVSMVSTGQLGNIYVDGNQVGSVDQDVNVGACTVTGFALGCLNSSTPVNFWNGYVGEVMAFKTNLSTARRHVAELYAGDKWAISV